MATVNFDFTIEDNMDREVTLNIRLRFTRYYNDVEKIYQYDIDHIEAWHEATSYPLTDRQEALAIEKFYDEELWNV